MLLRAFAFILIGLSVFQSQLKTYVGERSLVAETWTVVPSGRLGHDRESAISAVSFSSKNSISVPPCRFWRPKTLASDGIADSGGRNLEGV